MSKIHIAKYEPNRVGGGWSFARQFADQIKEYLSDYESADWYFITSPSMVSRDEVKQAQSDGKKILLRLDNIVRNSRNRNTGMSRMYDFAHMADVVIYQSDFARQLLMPFLKVDGSVILNGCDQSIFNTFGRTESVNARYLYSRFNRDETKNWEMARTIFQDESVNNEYALLTIVGQFSDEMREYNFDFFNDESYKYLGVISDPVAMANIYRMNDYLIYTYFNDACSNTLIEALSCGCEILDPYDMLLTGGAPEIMTAFEHFGDEYFDIKRVAFQYLEAMHVK